jgi:hypothetical protein
MHKWYNGHKENTMTRQDKTRQGLLLALILGLVLTGCPQEAEPDDPTYTVWTDSMSYAEFSSSVMSLDDGQYGYGEIAEANFKNMPLSNEYKHSWTESQIYNWFIGRGFDSSIANKEKSWLLTVNHGMIASRSGDIVYIILK